MNLFLESVFETIWTQHSVRPNNIEDLYTIKLYYLLSHFPSKNILSQPIINIVKYISMLAEMHTHHYKYSCSAPVVAMQHIVFTHTYTITKNNIFITRSYMYKHAGQYLASSCCVCVCVYTRCNVAQCSYKHENTRAPCIQNTLCMSVFVFVPTSLMCWN